MVGVSIFRDELEQHLDFLNNAGIAPGKTTLDDKDAEELKINLYSEDTLESWTDIYATNVVGPANLVRILLSDKQQYR